MIPVDEDLHERLTTAEAECERLRNELRDRDARYEEQALLLQERMQTAEEEAQARGERLAEAQKRLAELEAKGLAPDPGSPLRLIDVGGPYDGVPTYEQIQLTRDGEVLWSVALWTPEEAVILRELVRCHNILHGEDDEDDRAFGVALQEATERMYRRQADKAAERVNTALFGEGLVPEEVKAMADTLADIIYEEMGAGSLVSPEGEGEEATA